MRRTRVLLAAAILIAVMSMAGGASAGGGGSCFQATSTESRGTRVELAESCFGPTVLRVAVGDTVVWKNADHVEHTITAAGGVFDGKIAPGEEFTFKFASAGVYPYYCMFHPRMAGAVLVGDSTVSQAAPPVQPVARLGEAPEEGTSTTSAALIAVLVAAPLSFAAGRILRGRRQSI